MSEGVTIDYIHCQASQRAESRRLEEVEPDVTGATARFLQQAQDQLFGGSAMQLMTNALSSAGMMPRTS
eukprot:15343814-Ditylum_brightwellii.AAC.1